MVKQLWGKKKKKKEKWDGRADDCESCLLEVAPVPATPILLVKPRWRVWEIYTCRRKRPGVYMYGESGGGCRETFVDSTVYRKDC